MRRQSLSEGLFDTWKGTQWSCPAAFPLASSATISCPCPKETLKSSRVYSELKFFACKRNNWGRMSDRGGDIKICKAERKKYDNASIISLSLVQCVLLLLKHFTKSLLFQQAKLRALNGGLIAGIRKRLHKSIPLVLR